MALEFGFYDSYNHDRMYDAQNMNDIFEGVITDGVYAGVGDMFFVKPSIGLQVTVGTGRAWFKMTWNKNRTMSPVNLDRPDPVYDRIDTLCIRVRKNIVDRINDFFVYKGNILVEAQPPVLVDTDDTFYMPLANIRVRANAEDIQTSDIEMLVGRERCPFVTSILQQTNIKDLFAQWQAQFEDWWFSLQGILEGLEGGDLGVILGAIANKVDKDDKAKEEDIKLGSDSTWMTPKTTKSMIDEALGEGLDSIQETIKNGVVNSFNGRKGNVEPESGDYSAEDVGALALTGGILTGPLTLEKTLGVSGDTSMSGNLAVTGTTTLNSTVTMQGAVRLQSASNSNYGSVLNFGDSDYVHISEPSNNAMEVKANSINFVLSGSAGYNNVNFKINGTDPFAQIRSAISSAGSSYSGLTITSIGTGSITVNMSSGYGETTSSSYSVGTNVKLLIAIARMMTAIVPWPNIRGTGNEYVVFHHSIPTSGAIQDVFIKSTSTSSVFFHGVVQGPSSLSGPASFDFQLYGVY